MSVISNNTLAGSSGQGGGSGYAIERSLRFNPEDSPYLSRSAIDSGSSVYKYTVSWWMKIGSIGTDKTIVSFATNNAVNGWTKIHLRTDNTLAIFGDSPGTSLSVRPSMVFRDPSAWYHCCVSIDTTQSVYSDQIKFTINGVQQTDFAGTVPFAQNTVLSIGEATTHHIGVEPNSVGTLRNHFNGYLADMQVIEGQALSATDFGEYDANNVWQPKEYGGTYGTNGFHLDFSDISSNAAVGTDSSGNSNTWTVNNLIAASGIGPGITSTVPQDLTGDWRGIIGIVPTNTSGAVAVFPDGGGTANSKGTFFWSGLTIGDTITWYGTSLAQTSRNVTGDIDETSVTIPGTSLGSFQLTVNAASGSAKIDFNGTANCYGITPGPISTQYNDALRDTPVNGASADDTGAGGEISGSYCTWNPLTIRNGNGTMQLLDGNLNFGDQGTTGRYGSVVGTMAVASGKWYFEVTFGSGTGLTTNQYVGILPIEQYQSNNSVNAFNANSAALSLSYDRAYRGDDSITTNYASGIAIGDTVGIAFDVDAQTSTWYLNGVSLGAFPYALESGYTWTPFATDWSNNQPCSQYIINCGQRPWVGTPPSGYKALCTANLADPTIADSSTAFDTKLWNGNGSTQTITGLNFNPDLVWIKSRTSANGHNICNVISGTDKYLQSNIASQESTSTTKITSFNNDGFSIGSNTGVNDTNYTYVGWAWDGGSSTTTIAAGGLNSSLYDQSQTWSTYGTFTNTYTGTYDWPGVFNDGIIWDDYGSMFTDGTAKWTLTSSIACSNTVKILTRLDSTDCSFTINQGLSDETTIAVSGSGYQYLETSFTGNISNFQSNSPSTGGIYVMRIYVDGKALIDSGVTLANVPSLASTVRANPSAGFSIVSYTGAGAATTVSHNLGATPSFIIIKDRDAGQDWAVWHASLPTPTTGFLSLNLTDGGSNSAAYWNSTAPTNSVFSLGTAAATNGNSNNMIAYCFAPVEGYSAFGKYSGNSNIDGPFVYCGFKPRFLLLKGTSAARDWIILDTARDTGNVGDSYLHPNTSAAESAYAIADILSNGFKLRYSGGFANQTGEDYIWAAFAENPFKTARAR